METMYSILTCVLVGQAGPGLSPWLGSLLGPLFPLLAIAVLFYLLMIRPERRKRAELADMLQNLKKNDRVVTIGGIYGTIVNTQRDSDEITIKVDESTNTKLRMQRSAIARVLAVDGAPAAKADS